MYVKYDIRMTFSYENVSCEKQSLKTICACKIQKITCKKITFCICTVHLIKHYIAPSSYVFVQFYMGLPNPLNLCCCTHAFCACLCFYSALHHCSENNFLRLSSSHSESRKQEVLVAMAQRECYALTNTAQ